MEKLQAAWHWCEKWWRVAETPANGWSRQKVVSWLLVFVGLGWAFATSYYATRVHVLEEKLSVSLESSP